MNGEIVSGRPDDDIDDDLESADDVDTIVETDTIVMSEDIDVDNVGDISVEINVEELVAKIESGEGDAEEHRKEVHRRLEELEEKRRIEAELDSTYNFDLDDDL